MSTEAGQLQSDILDSSCGTALARLASSISVAPTAAAIAVLARAGAEKNAILRIMGEQVSDWTIEQITPVLSALGNPWDELLSPGRHHPKLEPQPGVRPLLDRLQQVGHVSSYKEGGMLSNEIKVNMRHD